ncbi:serine hydrolase domain-containing protein [Leifsonia sp. NPDC080035]|uniref:Serine hydrolase domain-containing protein n=1 Tax=Leifsonia sp. NPDC080035 TaxID=3143936 RepID=A0AAU7GFX2_9MICO
MRRPKRLHRAAIVVTAALAAFALAACTSVSAGSGLPEQQPGGLGSEVEKRLDSALTEAMTKAGASAGIAGVWAPWAGSWTSASGTTALKGSTPVTAQMTFRAGQLTLPMSCTVLLSLVDDGTVELDDPVSQWLPGLVGVTGVTLRELCQNTSGIGDYAGQLRGQFLTNPTRVWPPLELASDGIATARTGNPGEKYSASQTNGILLGMALQNATGKNWQQLYTERIFDRLGMDSTVLPDSTVMTPPGRHPVGYAALPDASGKTVCAPMHDLTRLSPSVGWTAGGVVSNLDDLRAFSQALAAGSLVSEKSADEQAKAVPAGASWQRYGLGMQLLGPLRGASGAIPGYVSAMYTDPGSGLTIVLALNNSTAGPGFAQALAERFASIVSKVPADKKGAKVVASLPWSEQQAVDTMTKASPCPLPAPKK